MFERFLRRQTSNVAAVDWVSLCTAATGSVHEFAHERLADLKWEMCEDDPALPPIYYHAVEHCVYLTSQFLVHMSGITPDNATILIHQIVHECIHATSFRKIEGNGASTRIWTGIGRRHITPSGELVVEHDLLNEEITNHFARKVLIADTVLTPHLTPSHVKDWPLASALEAALGTTALYDAYFTEGYWGLERALRARSINPKKFLPLLLHHDAEANTRAFQMLMRRRH